MERTLVLIFKDFDGNRKTLTIKNPIEELTTTNVTAAAQKMVETGILMTKSDIVASLESAVEITRSTRDVVMA